MIRIVICDDEREAVAQHEDIVKSSLQSCGIGYEIITYTLSSNLLYDIADNNFFYDLILLDIEMPGISGMELSGKIKTYLPNVKIIFITSHIEYAIDAFELSVFRYVPKNDLADRLVSAVVDAAKLIELEAGREYIIQVAGRMEKYRTKTFSIFGAMVEKIQQYIPVRECQKSGKVYSRFSGSLLRRSLFLLIGDIS